MVPPYTSLIDLDHVAARPIGALPGYADLAEIQPRRGSKRRRLFCLFIITGRIPERVLVVMGVTMGYPIVTPITTSTVAPFFARLQRLTIHPRSYDRRKQAKQRRKPFRAKETQPLRSLFCQFLGGRFTQVFTVLIIFGLSSFTLMVEVRLKRDTRLSLIIY